MVFLRRHNERSIRVVLLVVSTPDFKWLPVTIRVVEYIQAYSSTSRGLVKSERRRLVRWSQGRNQGLLVFGHQPRWKPLPIYIFQATWT